MQPEESKGSYHYPTHVTQYTDTALGALDPRDTEGLFTLAAWALSPVGTPPIFPPLFTLPGVPHNFVTTPPEKLLRCNAQGRQIGGTHIFAIAICPLDYAFTPVPTLADFRAIIFQTIGDTARVRWTGALWEVYDTTGTTVVVVPGQTFP